MPGEVLQAILTSLSQHSPTVGPPGNLGALTPAGPAPSGEPPNAPFAPPSQFTPLPGAAVPALVGTWVATGVTNQQMPFRSLIIFGDLGVFTSDTWVGAQSLGQMSGTYRLENGRLILQPTGGQAFAPSYQMEGDTLIMDVLNFASGVQFARQLNGGFPQ